MRRTLTGLATFLVLIVLSTASALAHPDSQPPADVGQQVHEAQGLTDEIKLGGPGAGNASPAIQAAFSQTVNRRAELFSSLAAAKPAAVVDLALSQQERASLPSFLQS